MDGRTILCEFCGHDHVPVSGARKRTIFANGCKGKDAAVYAIKNDEDQEKIIVVRVQAMRD